MTDRPDHPRRHGRRFALIAGAAAIMVLAGLAAVYGIAGPASNNACAASVATASRLAPLAHGEVAAVTVATSGREVPPLAFRDAEGKERSLADWRGRTVLLNLWATWCVPCRKEMPSLDALQTKLGGDKFEVVAVNIDTRDPEKPKAWLKENGIAKLAYFSDSSAKIFQDLKAIGRAFGMPTTLIIDPNGCELGYIAGPAEWASDDALKLIEAALKS